VVELTVNERVNDRPVTEQVLLMGPRKALVGIVTPAAEGTAVSPDRPAVVVLNSGIIHRVGANRMTVQLCRRLSQHGVDAVRFDLSGIGDSEPRDDGLGLLEASLADIKEALDTLETARGFKRFVLVGLCSGADHAVVYAGRDARVTGLVLLDPSIPHTPRYYLNHYARRATRLSSWMNIARGKHPLWQALGQRMGGASHAEPPEEGARADLDSPEARAFLSNAYAAAQRSGNRFLAVLTAEREDFHNYREQLLDAFPDVPFGDRLQLEYHEDTDHTFTAEVNRERVIGGIVGWVAGAV
jgi:pimeloyl-ACP methyl ester carboxylesterase